MNTEVAAARAECGVDPDRAPSMRTSPPLAIVAAPVRRSGLRFGHAMMTAPMESTFKLPSDRPDPDQVLSVFGLEGSVQAVGSVAGAWSHRVYRFETTGGVFAVKEMRNPWGDAGWQEWLEEAWTFELAAIGAGVSAPRPVPNPTTGGPLGWVGRHDGTRDAPVRVHHWVPGDRVGPGPVTPSVARWAGETLAVLHGLRVQPVDRSRFPVISTATAQAWPALVEAAGGARPEWAHDLANLGPAVATIAALAEATAAAPDQAEVVSHGDVDQKNMVMGAGGPVLCDWDVAAPLVPRRELADVALSLGAWEQLDIARQVIAAYRHAGGGHYAIEPADLGPAMMSGLDWLAINVERAIGLRPASDSEAGRSAGLVPGLISRLDGRVRLALQIDAVLN